MSEFEAGHGSSSGSLSHLLNHSLTPSAHSPSTPSAHCPSFSFADNTLFGFPYDAASRSDEEQDGYIEIDSESV